MEKENIGSKNTGLKKIVLFPDRSNFLKLNFYAATMLFLFVPHLLYAQETSEKLELVKSGRIVEARADWWGFNEEDSTKPLQAAINSGVKKLIIPNMGKAWIVHPITLADNQEIIFEPGTIIEAIKGGFKEKKDCLFSAKANKNITISGNGSILRMHKKDYQDKSQYTHSEWRHCIGLLSCENVKITGLTIMSSGGDGIYVGAVREPMNYCKDIVIKNCVLDDNHRQGISVISVVDLLVENCIIKNTRGTPPGAGIDFEPNFKNQRLFGITVKDCIFENNKGPAVIIFYTIYTRPGEDTEPISLSFENCKAIGTGFSGGFGPYPPFSKIDAKMSNCTQIVKGKTTVYNDFWKDFQNMQAFDKHEQEIVDRVKRVDIRGMKLKPLDNNAYKNAKPVLKKKNREGLALFQEQLPFLREKSSLTVYAEKGETLAFKVNFMRDYGNGMIVNLIAPSGDKNSIAKFSGKGVHNLSFGVKETGTHIIEFEPEAGWFNLSADNPDIAISGIAILALDGPIHLMKGLGTFYFYVPSGVTEFYVEAAGDGGERVKVSVYDPAGNLVANKDQIGVVHKFVVSRKDTSKGEIWSLKTEMPTDFSCEDFYIDILGIPPILYTERECILVADQETKD